MSIFGKLIQKDSEQPVGPHPSKPMLGLSISAGVVKATIWELKDHTIEIIGLGVKNFSDSGKETHPDFKSISEKAADAIDLACQVAEVDVKQTVFGVPQSWIEDEQLLPEYDDLTAKLAKNLDLEPTAYVSIPHALSYYLQYLHKTPPTAILIGSSREGAQIAYVENGKIKENSYVQWSGGSLGKNVDNGLLKFTSLTEIPATMFLYGFGDLSSARDELTKYDWSSTQRLGIDKKAPFSIATPKIYVLEEHADSLAVALVGAKDFARHNNIQGRLAIKSLEYSMMNSQMPAIPDHPVPAKADQSSLLPNESHQAHQEIVQIADQVAATESAPFGFVTGADIAQSQAAGSNPTVELSPTSSPLEMEAADIEHLPEDVHDEVTEEDIVMDKGEAHTAVKEVQKPWHEKLGEKSSFTKNIHGPRIKLSSRNARQLVYIVGIVLALLLVGGGGAAWAYWNVPKATVTVYVKPDNLEKQLSVTASEKVIAVGENSIPAQKITLDIAETREASTTGKRTTGQVAKGEVTIINKTGSAKTFNSGIEIRTASNQKFTLSENVTIASASAQTTDTGEIKTYGKSNVKAVAVDIGPEGNIEKDTSLALAGYTKDDYEAKVVDTFTGGSKKDIKVVSAQDRTNLSRDLKSDIQLKIPEQLRAKVSSEDIFLDKAWQISTTTEKFSKAVNDESNVLSLDLSMKVEAFVFKKADVEKLLEGVSTAAVPGGYELKDQSKDVRTDFVALSKEGVLTINAISRVNIIPIIDAPSITKQILGKSEDAARQTVLDNNKIFDVSFDYSMRLPDFINTLPHKEENITVERGVR